MKELCECVNTPMDTVKEMTVIVSTNLRRGDGKATPIRIVTQYWCIHGKLITEVDPAS